MKKIMETLETLKDEEDEEEEDEDDEDEEDEEEDEDGEVEHELAENEAVEDEAIEDKEDQEEKDEDEEEKEDEDKEGSGVEGKEDKDEGDEDKQKCFDRMTMATLRNPGCFKMYTFTKHAAYGVLEVYQNILLDFKQAAGNYKLQRVICEGLALFLCTHQGIMICRTVHSWNVWRH